MKGPIIVPGLKKPKAHSHGHPHRVDDDLLQVSGSFPQNVYLGEEEYQDQEYNQLEYQDQQYHNKEYLEQEYNQQEYPSQEYREQVESGPEHHEPIYETIDSYPDFPQPKQIPSPGPDFRYPQKSYKNQDIPIFEVPHESSQSLNYVVCRIYHRRSPKTT